MRTQRLQRLHADSQRFSAVGVLHLLGWSQQHLGQIRRFSVVSGVGELAHLFQRRLSFGLRLSLSRDGEEQGPDE